MIYSKGSQADMSPLSTIATVTLPWSIDLPDLLEKGPAHFQSVYPRCISSHLFLPVSSTPSTFLNLTSPFLPLPLTSPLMPSSAFHPQSCDSAATPPLIISRSRFFPFHRLVPYPISLSPSLYLYFLSLFDPISCSSLPHFLVLAPALPTNPVFCRSLHVSPLSLPCFQSLRLVIPTYLNPLFPFSHAPLQYALATFFWALFSSWVPPSLFSPVTSPTLFLHPVANLTWHILTLCHRVFVQMNNSGFPEV